LNCSFTDIPNNRNFLLFIPASAPSLKAVLSYFSSTVKVNLEGDVQISDDTIQGLGTRQQFLHAFFGSLFLIAKPLPPSPLLSDDMATFEMPQVAVSPAVPHSAVSRLLPPRPNVQDLDALVLETQESLWQEYKSVLIACVPNPGYFVAGGVAGIVSRTSTAPLDRLKVYLIAQTSVTKEAVEAAKSGNIFRALANSWRPLAIATKELWQAGGMRSLYAGMLKPFYLTGRFVNMTRKRPECGEDNA
jgi:solute carrier family 25 phosphate transporter 23/24/25/41